jgi:integrase
LLALLVGTGLRRSEAASLTTEHLQIRESRQVIVDLIGKHYRIRSVVLPAWAAASLQVWMEAADIRDGRIFGAVDKADHLAGDSLTPQAIYKILQGYAGELGLKLAPHDLRRTHARLARDGGASLEQIQISLGHASLTTTERYLGLHQNLTDSPGDHIAVCLKAG